MTETTPVAQAQRIEDPDQAVNPNHLLRRFQEIMAAHRPAPEQQADENRYRNLAARLLQERRELAEELSEAGIENDQMEQEFTRRNAAIERFATIWTAEDPDQARLKPADAATEAKEAAPPNHPITNTLPWKPMLALPGYDGAEPLNAAIRTLGRQIFGVFPCFQRMSTAAREADADALGQIMTLSSLLEDHRTIVRARLAALEGSCLPVARQRLPGLNAMPGYHPVIAVALSEETSFLVVRERQNAGAPVNADTIYAWNGGLNFYRNNPERIADLRRLLDIPARGITARADLSTTLRLM